ncbi:MAG: GH92 family glycosyl hydrolase [Bacteroidetes bacterium]|nr:GH92 family glycosyl hydrolase [Bacteroidota bacterium]
MRNLSIPGILIFSLFLYSCKDQTRLPADFVNPFIGTGGHGHTYPGASLPFGMIQVSPDTRLDGWDGCSAYHQSDSVIYGFSHTHLSGTGCSDYGDILIMPVKGHAGLDNYGFRSGFMKSREKARPGYYSVELDGPGVRAELTSTLRTGIHRYNFKDPAGAGLVLDLKHRDLVLDSRLKINGTDEIEGMRTSQAWALKQNLFFVIKFSKPITEYRIQSGGKFTSGIKEINGSDIKAEFSFRLSKGEPLLLKIGISAISTEGARRNLEKENPGWNFEAIEKSATDAWNKELGKIIVEGGSNDQKTIFYTALYHAMLNPNMYMDVDKQYLGRDMKPHIAQSFDYYTVFSLWDTYRAEHPLLTLIDQKRTNDFINTFLMQYQEGGKLPVWELSSNETGCMIGYHSVPVIVDAYLKGITDFDARLALQAMKNSAQQDDLGLRYYKSMGYIPSDQEGESVSKTLEYAYDDWCIAQMAKALGQADDYNVYIRRAQYYKNLYDKSTGFMRAKTNAGWFSPFDPSEVNFNYTEANAWQYSFSVPQDISGLMNLMGGREKFAEKLDAMLKAPSVTSGREQADISGMIGQYAHGNEPSHHMAYLYDYAGKPWKTQELIHMICNQLYRNDPDGLCGNEDCGQMSAWYVLSAMGFYPVVPGSGVYAIGTPLFPKVSILLENGKKFIIEAKGISKKQYFISSATLNGQVYNKCFISHTDILKGGTLTFTMSAKPDTAWGSSDGDFPVSIVAGGLITPIPAVEQAGRTFIDSTILLLSCPLTGAKIYYTLNGKDPDEKSAIYSRPLYITKTTKLKAFALAPGLEKSFTIEASFMKIPKNRKITLFTKYAGQYSAGGDLALIDFIRGGDSFKTGAWQGYEGTDVCVVVDLGSVQPLHELSLGCLQDQEAWIFMPLEVGFAVSTDNINFKTLPSVKNTVDEKLSGAVIRDYTVKPHGVSARYVKVLAVNRGNCPVWHPGTGKKAWVFVDEIIIK